MKEKRKRYFAAAVLLAALILLIGGGIFLMRRAAEKTSDGKAETETEAGQKKEEEQDEKEEEMQEEREIQFENFSVLEPYFQPTQIEGLQEQITRLLSQEAYGSVTKVVCEDTVTDQQNRIEFYCVLDEETGNVLHVVYRKKTAEFELNPEEIPAEVLDEQPRENVENFLPEQPDPDTQEAGTEEKLPSRWDQTEEDNTPVELSGKEELDGKIPEDKLQTLETELLEFLKGEQEYRRVIAIEKESVSDSEKEISFWGGFQNPRIDKKKLFVVYDKETNAYRFSLEVQEE